MEIKTYFYSRGEKLSAILGMPDTTTTLKPAVVLCHGHSRSKSDGLGRLAELLIAEGYITLRFDFRGCGYDAVNRFQLYCCDDWTEDLMNAISYLKSIPAVDPERIGAAGVSMGASTVVNTTALDKRIHSTVSMSGIGDCERWVRGMWSSEQFDALMKEIDEDSICAAATGHSRMVRIGTVWNVPMEEQNEFDMASIGQPEMNRYVSLGATRALLRYKPILNCPAITTPVFFAHGGADLLVPYEEQVSMYDAIKSEKKQIKKYPGVEHDIPVDPARDTVFADIISWFRDTL